MSTWISLVVLSLAVDITLGFPRPEEYHIPEVGQGSRAQYYVLHSDGTYKYGYDTGDGVYEQSMAQAPGEVSGAFGYKDPTGADIKLEYTADERGFVPHGGHLPAQPDNHFGLEITEEPRFDIRANKPPITPFAVESHSSSTKAVPSSGNVPVEPAVIRSSANDDGSYSFSYETSSSSRSESADAHNSVSGQYSFDGDDGISHGISYTAGSETGYIAEGDSLPRGPAVPGAESGVPTGNIIPVLSEEEANALASASTNVSPQTFASVATEDAASSEETDSCEEHHTADGKVPIDEHNTSTAEDNTVPVETAHIISSVPGDGSYRFSYETPSSSRSESADAHNSVTGHYSFISEDGINYKINYNAGPETGFIAEGDSLPIGPSVPGAENGIPTGQILPDLSEDNVNIIPSHNSHITSDISDTNFTETESPSDSSYFFKYDAGDSARLESADVNLNIKGNYRFVVPEGLQYTVRYIAGSDTGFVTSIKEETPTSDVHSNSEPAPCQEVPATTGDTALLEEKHTDRGHTDPPTESNENGDAAGTPSTADANVYGKVVGHQTYVDQIGNEYRITYITAPNTYINLEEYHNPIPDKSIHSDTSTKISGKVGQLTYIDNNGTEYNITYVAPSTTGLNHNEYPIAIPNGVIDINAVNADADGNVVGHQTYIDENGNEYKITYIVTPEEYSPSSMPDSKVHTEETHSSSLPVGPSGPGAESGIPTGYILASVSSSGDTDSLQQSNENTDKTEAPAKTDVNGEVVGHGTYVDQNGTKYRIIYVAPKPTGFNHNVYPNPNPKTTVDTVIDNNDTLTPITPSAEESQIRSSSSINVSHKRAEVTQQDPGTSLSKSHSIRKVGDVLLHQYDPTNRDKYGYVYTAIH